MTKEEKKELQELREDFKNFQENFNKSFKEIMERMDKSDTFIGMKMDGFSFKLEELEAQNDALAERFENATTIENKVEIPEKVVKKAIRKGTKDAVGSSFPSNVKVEEMLKEQQTKMDEISQRVATMAELVRNM